MAASADGKAVAILHSESVMKSLPNPQNHPSMHPRYREGGEVDTKSLPGDDETKIRPTLQNNNQTMEIRFRLATIKLWREGGGM